MMGTAWLVRVVHVERASERGGERGANAGRNGRGVGANKDAPGAVVVGVGALRGRSVNKKRLLGKNSQPPPQ